MTGAAGILDDEDRKRAVSLLRECHYTRSVPSGKSVYVGYSTAVVVFSIPANNAISRWLVGEPNVVWELSRLWAPDGHAPNLLTKALSEAARLFHAAHPEAVALVSYADPNVGHIGGVYRAASWVFLGQCAESRNYRDSEGRIFSRRAFHSGRRSLTKAEIEARGFTQHNLPGKLRYARGLTKGARARIARLGAESVT